MQLPLSENLDPPMNIFEILRIYAVKENSITCIL
jgi:hypothetical protein